MYHSRFSNTHYMSGFKWGRLLLKNNNKIEDKHTFKITEERIEFAKKCIPIYEDYFPEVLEEIKGISDGQNMEYEKLYTFLLSMYCFEFSNKCTCFAIADKENIVLARNSDFLVELEKLYMNCLYKISSGYFFNGNTTAFVEMEDGVNEHGMAVGLTFVYPHIRKPGLNAGMLVRYILEKCKYTNEAIEFLKKVPLASAQTITLADKNGNIAVVECNPEKIEVIEPERSFVIATNNFVSKELKKYRNPDIDDLFSEKRYIETLATLKKYEGSYNIEMFKEILKGKYGFICQYDRKKGEDTVWSVLYDLKNKAIYRVEGNPSRKKFKSDTRMEFSY